MVMDKITKREKYMLIVLGAVIVVGVGFMLIINPMIDTYTTNTAAILDLEMQLEEAKVAIAQKPIVEKKLAETVELISAEGKNFYPVLSPWDAERTVTKIMHDNEVAYHSVSISPLSPFVKPPEEDENGNIPAVDPEAPIENNGITETIMTIECHTTHMKFIEMLDDFEKLEKRGCVSEWAFEYDESTPEIKGTITIKLFSIE